MFIPPDMSCVKVFRKALRQSLESYSFSDEDIMQIELAADEALTNSVSANVCSNSDETIICRWIIQDLKITLFILDYGCGFRMDAKNEDPSESQSPTTMIGFLEKIRNHQCNKPETLPFNGVRVGHKNVGKGLKIIHSLMDSVKIMFHADGEVMEDGGANSERITGSIVELEYSGKKRNVS
ncbi:ATP-binding protein [Leptospira sp. GIMC2001]|nr:ATP-binding protein [Leptospira sp. GIMC2001]WCL51412.1 ATP-binding protein [Leptospira sp. GIMC2001]